MRDLKTIPVLVVYFVFPFAAGACVGVTDSDVGIAQSPTTLAAGGIPTFQVDPSWPNEMPNLWILGSVTSVFVDSNNHVWITHLPETLTPEETSAVQDPPIGECCVPAPDVIEFDADGNLDAKLWPRSPN